MTDLNPQARQMVFVGRNTFGVLAAINLESDHRRLRRGGYGTRAARNFCRHHRGLARWYPEQIAQVLFQSDDRQHPRSAAEIPPK